MLLLILLALAATQLPPRPVRNILHSVTISWTESPSPDVIGYNVYRSLTTGGPYTKLNRAPVGTVFTDVRITAGMTYYYVATAVDIDGNESAFSMEVRATIPFP